MSRSSENLTCRGISVRFGGFLALNDVSIDFCAGRVTALIGPNGAGKTTLMNVLSGLQAPSNGMVSLGGVDITRMPTHRRARAGVARSFQIISIYPEMTVFENVRLGVESATKRSAAFFWRRIENRVELREQTYQHLERFDLGSRSSMLAGEMSHGEQRTLELALSLAGDPRVLLLDEPLAGVGHGEREPFIELLTRVIKGRTTVLVEHNMDAVMNLASTIVCLVGGSVLATGTPEEIREDVGVRRAYLGE